MRKTVDIIENIETVEELLEYGKTYYSEIPIDKRSIIFNTVIFNRKINLNLKISLKIATNLSFIFMTFPEKNFFSKSKVHDFQNEINIFLIFVSNMEKLYVQLQLV